MYRRLIAWWKVAHKKMLLTLLAIAAVDALTTQLYFNLMVGGFRVSLSVVVLPVLLYLNPKVNPLLQTLVIMGFGLITRSIFGMGIYESWLTAFQAEYQTLFFEAIYGGIYYWLYYKHKEKTLTLWIGVILLADFLANCSELFSRFHLEEALVLQSLPVLFLIATVRSVAAAVLVLGYGYYRTLLRRDEHQRRYENLLMIASQLSAENYLMQKNMTQIENVMSDAFMLYEELSKIENPGSKKALNIAKEVHEIKKNYAQVMKGLETFTDGEDVAQKMSIKDLLDILLHCLANEWQAKDTLPVYVALEANVVLHQHYLFLSIIRNLVVNALEAVRNQEAPKVVIRVKRIETDGAVHFLFEVIDNGEGIRTKDIPCIFDPGFSTKFSPTTGDIQRGLGLTLVKEIVENTFGGEITVDSQVGSGTVFKVIIPGERMEG